MPTPRDPPVEIPLGGSLDESTARLFRQPGALRRSANSDTSKQGGLRKRRGFRLLPLDTDISGATIESVFVCVGNYKDELVVIGRNNVYGVHADTNIVDGQSVSLRGPSMVGDWQRVDIHSADLAEEP